MSCHFHFSVYTCIRLNHFQVTNVKCCLPMLFTVCSLLISSYLQHIVYNCLFDLPFCSLTACYDLLPCFAHCTHSADMQHIVYNCLFYFAGRYTIGTPHHEDGVCGQIIRSENVPQGILLSPTYPGMYPDNVFCYYKILGKPGQRIKFTFLDLDLYFGGQQ